MKKPSLGPACTGCTYRGPTCVCHPQPKRALLILNLGTPDDPSVSSVRRYLREFLSDPFVITLPRGLRWFTPVLASIIGFFRSPKTSKAYASIWWKDGSPLKVITERQVRKLSVQLGANWDVRYAMRYASPSIRDVVASMVKDGITDLVVVPMYPQYAGPTTGTALKKLYAELQRAGLRCSVTVRNQWYDDRRYIEAQANMIADAVKTQSLGPKKAFLLFSTHSMPTKYIAAGDPYEGQTRRTIELVRRRIGWPEDRMGISFQSRLGPVAWLTPSTEDVLNDLANRGERDVIVCPIGFTVDCIETLEEIGDQYAKQFAQVTAASGKPGQLHVMPAVNDDDRFIDSLAHIARRGSQPLKLSSPIEPILSAADSDVSSVVERLVMVGVSMPGTLRGGEVPELSGQVSSSRLRQLGRERADILAAVRECSDADSIDGCIWLSTCRRSELYALAKSGDHAAAEAVLRDQLGAGEARALRGRAAFRHLLSTAAGLQSILPGDRDVAEQVRSAVRMSEQAGGGSVELLSLFDTAAKAADFTASRTKWSRFATDFADAALRQLNVWPSENAAVTIVGGSTTSRQLLKFFSSEGSDDRLTFVYRGKGRKTLVRFIRQVAAECERVRVGRYDSTDSVGAMATADYVFLGLDERQPILTREALEIARAGRDAPLTIVDFNAHGSTCDVAGLPGVTLIDSRTLVDAAAKFGQSMTKTASFAECLAEAESYIEQVARSQVSGGTVGEEQLEDCRPAIANAPGVEVAISG